MARLIEVRGAAALEKEIENLDKIPKIVIFAGKHEKSEPTRKLMEVPIEGPDGTIKPLHEHLPDEALIMAFSKSHRPVNFHKKNLAYLENVAEKLISGKKELSNPKLSKFVGKIIKKYIEEGRKLPAGGKLTKFDEMVLGEIEKNEDIKHQTSVGTIENLLWEIMKDRAVPYIEADVVSRQLFNKLKGTLFMTIHGDHNLKEPAVATALWIGKSGNKDNFLFPIEIPYFGANTIPINDIEPKLSAEISGSAIEHARGGRATFTQLGPDYLIEMDPKDAEKHNQEVAPKFLRFLTELIKKVKNNEITPTDEDGSEKIRELLRSSFMLEKEISRKDT